MKAMILAAGYGRRLAPLTDETPKPLLPIDGKPLILHQLVRLKEAGIQDVVINLHHLGHLIEACLGDGSTLGLNIQYSREAQLLDTGGGIKKALTMLGDAPFVLCNGDILCDLDFRDLSVPQGEDLGHLLLAPKPDYRATGDFLFKNGRIVARGDDYIYCGISVLDPKLFAQSPEAPFSLADLLFRAAAEGKLSGQAFFGHWTDIGTPDEYARVRGTPAS
ncbi:MAG TPA: mannose-1-phosphate guanylyltransferase [Gammaproteobacteria bacterium]|nr:mannose-1-phosphate guanylyltransferase [Gammaproteobacteria bacterium]